MPDTANVMRSEQIGAAQRGPALLAGLCGVAAAAISWWCITLAAITTCCAITVVGSLDNGEPRCIGFAGLVVDQAIAREILRVVRPAAIEAAIVPHEEQARKGRRSLGGTQARPGGCPVQRATGAEAVRAADPENRLVTDELERRWNQSLQRVREIEAQPTTV